ncbi:MAG: TetR/AcrR family transcriptional regulator [Bacteroidia bacterium]|nr:TetR/AcrR family transcriptional regulator [Bacteroidia bacterium]
MGRKSKAKVRQKEILSHFYDVIIDEGFEGASIAKIAKRMDVNPSLLIHYFSTKDAMVVGLMDHIVSTYSAQLFPDFSKVTDPAERWEDVIDVSSRIQWDRIMNSTVFFSFYTLALRMPEIKQRFNALYDGILETLTDEIGQASKAGVIKVDSPSQAAEKMVSIIEGYNFYYNLKPDGDDADKRAEVLKGVLSGLFA